MKTLAIKAPGVMSAPIAGTPKLPDIQSNILFLYRAEGLSVTDGSNVANWPNSAGSWSTKANLSVASGTPPKFVLDGVSAGHPLVRFTRASATFLRTPTGSPISPNQASPITVSALVRFAANAANNTCNIFSGRDGTAGAFFYLRREPDGRINMGAGNFDPTIYSDVTAPLNTWLVITAVFDGVNSRMHVGPAVKSGSTSQAFWDGIVVGANGSQVNNLDGDLSILQCFSRALTDSEARVLRETWLNERGLPV